MYVKTVAVARAGWRGAKELAKTSMQCGEMKEMVQTRYSTVTAQPRQQRMSSRRITGGQWMAKKINCPFVRQHVHVNVQTVKRVVNANRLCVTMPRLPRPSASAVTLETFAAGWLFTCAILLSLPYASPYIFSHYYADAFLPLLPLQHHSSFISMSLKHYAIHPLLFFFSIFCRLHHYAAIIDYSYGRHYL